MKKVIKGILKEKHYRGNVIPWCAFAAFELEASALPNVIAEIYKPALELAWSLKQKSTYEKGIGYFVIKKENINIFVRINLFLMLL